LPLDRSPGRLPTLDSVSKPLRILLSPRWILLAGVLLPSRAGMSEPQCTDTPFQIADSALRWMPASFRGQVSLHRASFESGVRKVLSAHPASPEEKSLLEKEIVEKTKSIAQKLRSRPKFGEVAIELGSLAPIILYLNIPDVDEACVERLNKAITCNADLFRLVVYNSSDQQTDAKGIDRLIFSMRSRRAVLTEKFLANYSHLNENLTSERIDPKSALFGLSSLIYSHAVNDIATCWLWIWKSANGDMSGTERE